MTPAQITLVQESFTKVAPIADTAAELFYGRLFTLDPDLKLLFKGDMKEQGAKLMKMIGVAVNGLSKLDEIIPAVQALGERHIAYNVKAKHYQTVGEALIWTLEQGLADAFTEQVKEAWLITYNTLASVMIEASTTKS